MSQIAASKEKQAKLSFFAGALFFLAGAINLFVGIHTHRSTSNGMGGMLICVGVLWIAVGARNRREALALESVQSSPQGVV